MWRTEEHAATAAGLSEDGLDLDASARGVPDRQPPLRVRERIGRQRRSFRLPVSDRTHLSGPTRPTPSITSSEKSLPRTGAR